MRAFYRNTAKNAKETKGQAALVLAAVANTTPDAPLTVDQVAERIKEAGLKTVQSPRRIASYYLQIFKKTGVVRAVEVNVDEANDTEEVRAGVTEQLDEPVTEAEVVETVETEDELVGAE